MIRPGVKKGHPIEDAQLHHLRALDVLPAEVIVPPRLKVSRRSGKEIVKRVSVPRPAKRLRELLKGEQD